MIFLYLLLTTAAAVKVTDSSEDLPPDVFNTTTLYPVTRNTTNDEAKQNTATSWKVETTFADSNEETGEKAENSSKKEEENRTEKEELVLEKPERANSSKEFKPSPHLGNFYDEENLRVTPTRESFDSFSTAIKKPPVGFLGSIKSKHPKEVFKDYPAFPYKLERPILTRAKDEWTPSGGSGLESKPTVEAPVRIPAGVAYNLPDAFKEKPGLDGDDEEFGLSFNEGSDGKEGHVLKRRVNPWKKVLNLLVSLIPVGIIVSALTPRVITIENVDNFPNNQHSDQYLRRSGSALDTAAAPGASPPPAELPVISERCRRRLLCELRADHYYQPVTAPARRVKHCYKLYCEDLEGLTRTLQWLLLHQKGSKGFVKG